MKVVAHRGCRWIVVLALGAIVSASGAMIAQDKQPAAKAEAKKPAGRLPAYFAAIVNAKQREEIYALQMSYSERIEALEKQLEALIDERDEKVDSVLTPEQLAEVNKKREEAKARRTKRVAAAETPAAEK